MSDMELKVGVDTADLETGIEKAIKAINRFSAEAGKASGRMNNMAKSGDQAANSFKRLQTYSGGALANLRDMSIVLTTATYAMNTMRTATQGWVKQIVDTNAEIEKLTFLLANMSKAERPFEEAGQQIAYLRDMAKSVPFSMSLLSDSFVKFKAAGLDPMDGSLQAIVDSVTAFGGSDEQLQRITLGIQQMAGKSVLSMEEMRQQLGEAMPRAMELMARALNTNIGDLSEKIATGTVDAKSSLKVFFKELELVYGGTSQRMMHTFNGQVSQLRTNFQLLATQGSNKQFFEELKESMQSINNFLSSGEAVQIADRVGKGLSKVLSLVSSTVQVLYEYSGTIENIGILIGAAVAGKLVIGAFNTFSTSMINITRGLGNLKKGVGELSITMSLLSQHLGTSDNKFRDLRTSIGTGVVPAFKGLASAVTAIAPIALAAGAALMIAVDYFDLFGTKHKEAFENAVEFGAKTREEWEKLERDAKKRTKTLERDLASMERMYADGSYLRITQLPEDQFLKLMENLRKELADIESGLRDGVITTENRISEASAKQARLRMNDKFDLIQKIYEKEAISIRSNAELEKETAEETGKSVRKIEQEIIDKTHEARLKAYKEKAKAAKEYVDSEQKLLDGLEPETDAYKKTEASLREIQKIWIKALDDENELRKNGPAAIVTQGGDNSEKNLGKINTQVENLRQKYAELTGSINGSSSALEGMLQKIQQEEFGPIKDMTDEMRQQLSVMFDLTAQVDVLSGAMRGYKSAMGNIDRAEADLLKRRAKARRTIAGEAESSNPADEIRIDIEAGVYEGLGPKADAAMARLRTTLAGLKANAQMADLLGAALQQNAFGQGTNDKITGVINSVGNLNEKMRETVNIANGMSFNNMTMPNTPGMAPFVGGAYPYQSLKKSSGNQFLDFIAGPESGGDYNRSLDNGRWIGGEKNLVAMTLNEIRSLQKMMLSNPANRAKYKDANGNNTGSSAIGRYQIVGKTLQSLMDKHGLSGNELYDEQMQDFLAMSLARGRGRDAAGLKNEWEGLRGLSDESILAAYDKGNLQGPTKWAANNFNSRQALDAGSGIDIDAAAAAIETTYRDTMSGVMANLNKALKEVDVLYEDVVSDEAKAEFVKISNDFKKKTETAILQGQDMGSLEAELRTKMADSTERIYAATAEEKETLIAAAKKADEQIKSLNETNKNRRDIAREQLQLSKEQEKVDRSLAEARKKLDNPNAVLDSSDVQRIKQSYDEYLEKVKSVYGEEHELYKQGITARDNMLKSQLSKEVVDRQITENAKDKAFRQSMMSETQLRQEAMQEAIRIEDEQLARYIASGMSEIEARRMIEERKAAIVAQYAQQDDKVSQTFAKWGDLQGGIQGKIEGWMNSFADGLTGLITGTGDLKGAIDGMIKDVVNMSLKWAMSQMFNKGGAPAMGGKGGDPLGKAGQVLTKGVGTRHLGGSISGMQGMAKNVNALSFMGAKYFHGGGIIGREGLLPNEVPIIGKKGEVVFTPGQVEALGQGIQGGTTNVISPNITVNASGGTADQNADLAKRISRDVEKSMSAMVAKELSRQQRPGNMIGRRG